MALPIAAQGAASSQLATLQEAEDVEEQKKHSTIFS